MQPLPVCCSLLLLLPFILSAPSVPQQSFSHHEDYIFEGKLFQLNLQKKAQTIERNELTVVSKDRFKRDEASSNRTKTEDVDLPTCLLCVCLSGSVYCEETDIEEVPPLPKETAYLYARFNKIKKITAKDFSDFPTLRRIDLTGNLIEDIDDKAFEKLPLLEQLNLAENKLTRIPALPTKLTVFNVNDNQIKSKGIKANVFKKLTSLAYLYLANNQLESVPQNLPESLKILHLQQNNITSITDDTFCKSNDTRYIRNHMAEIRMEGNPVILGKHPNSFTCLKTLPSGSYFK
ncbi:hypothetical protein XELAEV_18023763mg [Xenopus laevis]|uniref:Mimecan n=1 Tax=Xenopus laevis TaxID=8355 RepID=A0A974HPE6_XENLA|nr:hypothetical protein XELAEV_18023763mg [Xenopus laevis]